MDMDPEHVDVSIEWQFGVHEYMNEAIKRVFFWK